MPRPIPSALRVAAVGLLVLVSLPILYLLSTGPAWAMVRREQANWETFYVVYRPLLEADNNTANRW